MYYNNDGDYSRNLINDALQHFRNETGREIEIQDPDFVDFIWSECEEMATGFRVKSFLKEAIKIKQENGNSWKPYQIKCLFKTYSNIKQAKIWKEGLE